jgi:hypothetical protein
MGLLDRLKGRGRGVPGRAVVVVNRSPGPETGKASLRSQLRARLRPLPDGNGPEGDISQLVPSHQAHLVTAGMEVPALLDPETGQPVGVVQEGLDEAIGRHYLAIEPEHGTWEAALAAKQKALRQETGMFGDVRHGIDQVKGVAGAARALPGGLLGAAREWKDGIAAMGGDEHPAGEPVEGVGFDAWVSIKAALAHDPAAAATGESAYAESHGVPSGRWQAINSTWEQQVRWNQNARALYDKAMEEAAKASE